MRFTDDESQGPVIRDRRRIDPETGQVRRQSGAHPGPARTGQPGPGQPGPGSRATARPGAPGQAAGSGSGSGDGSGRGDDGTATADLGILLAERTADVQRIQAEYANYRKRVERDRMAVREQALANVLSQLLPVLDDIGRAREHGELVGGFKQVAEALEAATAKLGLTTYGETGDPFDPTLHEALMHSYSAEVTEPTCVDILQPGYKVGERILRPARVAVAEPDETAPGQDARGQDADDGQAAADQAARAGSAEEHAATDAADGRPASDAD
jgi:molecular chaperone GrpE